jgi:hypothetical protein
MGKDMEAAMVFKILPRLGGLRKIMKNSELVSGPRFKPRTS